MKHVVWIPLLVLILYPDYATSQSFYFGGDLSYVNEMEDCGASYKVNGEMQDPYTIFMDHGCNLVRLRTWHTPSWYDNLNAGNRYSDYDDVRNSILRAKAAGMNVLLDFHLSDTWADPAHQVAPLAWLDVLDNLPALQDSLYNYIYGTLQKLAAENLLPEIVQIGNETNKGILQSQASNDAGWSLNWPRNSALFNTAIDAVRDIEQAYVTPIQIALHVANPNDVDWLMEQFWDNGVRDFDIIGISYYYAWHNVLIPFVGNTITQMKNLYPGKEIMILETAYPWTNANADGANNVLGAGYPGYSPTPESQRDWMIALTQEVIDHGGKGVVYWEPAWVSTGCSTQWAVGSHWDNATFFDFSANLQANGGIGWMEHTYDFVLSVPPTDNSQIGPIIHFVNGEIRIENTGNVRLEFPCTLLLYSLDGRILQSHSIGSPDETNVMRIPLSSIVPGFYTATLTTTKGVVYSAALFLN